MQFQSKYDGFEYKKLVIRKLTFINFNPVSLVLKHFTCLRYLDSSRNIQICTRSTFLELVNRCFIWIMTFILMIFLYEVKLYWYFFFIKQWRSICLPLCSQWTVFEARYWFEKRDVVFVTEKNVWLAGRAVHITIVWLLGH